MNRSFTLMREFKIFLPKGGSIKSLHGGPRDCLQPRNTVYFKRVQTFSIQMVARIDFMVSRIGPITVTVGLFQTDLQHHRIDRSGHRDRKNEEEKKNLR